MHAVGLHLDYQPEVVATPRLMSTYLTVEIDRKLHAEKRRLIIATLSMVWLASVVSTVYRSSYREHRKLTLSVNLVAVGLVLRLEHEVFVCRSKEHFAVALLAKSFITASQISLTHLILIQSL
jgi:hypothetical protein